MTLLRLLPPPAPSMPARLSPWPRSATRAARVTRATRATQPIRSRTPWRIEACRIGVAVLHALIDHPVVFAAVGAINRRHPFLESVFLAYPASREYALRYARPRRITKHLWRPVPTGLMRQDGKWILMLSIPATEAALMDRANTDHLVAMVERVERVRDLVGAHQTSFAGIIPGILNRRGIRETSVEGDMTARIVEQAIAQLRAEHHYRDVVIVGAAGFIGGRVMSRYAGEPSVHGVEVRTGAGWPEGLPGPTLVVNIANRSALDGHVGRLRAGDTVLNEVYPPPSAALRRSLAEQGVALVHLVGVKGASYPSLPGPYGGAIPCCAAWAAPQAEVVLRRM